MNTSATIWFVEMKKIFTQARALIEIFSWWSFTIRKCRKRIRKFFLLNVSAAVGFSLHAGCAGEVKELELTDIKGEGYSVVMLAIDPTGRVPEWTTDLQVWSTEGQLLHSVDMPSVGFNRSGLLACSGERIAVFSGMDVRIFSPKLEKIGEYDLDDFEIETSSYYDEMRVVHAAWNDSSLGFLVRLSGEPEGQSFGGKRAADFKPYFYFCEVDVLTGDRQSIPLGGSTNKGDELLQNRGGGYRGSGEAVYVDVSGFGKVGSTAIRNAGKKFPGSSRGRPYSVSVASEDSMLLHSNERKVAVSDGSVKKFTSEGLPGYDEAAGQWAFFTKPEEFVTLSTTKELSEVRYRLDGLEGVDKSSVLHFDDRYLFMKLDKPGRYIQIGMVSFSEEAYKVIGDFFVFHVGIMPSQE